MAIIIFRIRRKEKELERQQKINEIKAAPALRLQVLKAVVVCFGPGFGSNHPKKVWKNRIKCPNGNDLHFYPYDS